MVICTYVTYVGAISYNCVVTELLPRMTPQAVASSVLGKPQIERAIE